jgi:ATP-dependent DNA helicase DinG
MTQDLIYLDLETTGTSETTNHIIDIGAVLVTNGVVKDRFTTLVKPPVLPDANITALTGITAQMLSDAPTLAEVKSDFLKFIGKRPLVCHNAAFEEKFLRQHISPTLPNPFWCSLELAVLVFPEFKSHRLEDFIQAFGWRDAEVHRGLADAEDTVKLVQHIDALLDTKPYEVFVSLAKRQMAETDWAWLPFFEKRNVRTGALPKFQRFEFENERPLLKAASHLAAVTERLQDEAFWKKTFPNYHYRKAQETMTSRMIETLAATSDTPHVYLAEAPTGIGKTLGYAAAALHELNRDAGDDDEPRQIVISTNTKALQEQIVTQTIPQLQQQFEIRGLNATIVKGMNNYACVKKVVTKYGNLDGQNLFESLDVQDRLAGLYLTHWSMKSDSGDLENISGWLSVTSPVVKWKSEQLAAQKVDCDGRGCAYYENCFYYKKESEVKAAHVVVVNHSLLMRYPKSYPSIKHLVVDEAHALEDAAFEAFTEDVTSDELIAQARDVASPVSCYAKTTVLLVRVKQEGWSSSVQKSRLKEIRSTAETLETQTNAIRTELLSIMDELAKDKRYDWEAKFPSEAEEKSLRKLYWRALRHLTNDLITTLAKFEKSLRKAATDLLEADDEFKTTPEVKETLMRADLLKEKLAVLVAAVEQPPETSQDKCYLVSMSGTNNNQKSWRLRITPSSVAEMFQLQVAENLASLVLTSATLATGGTFDKVKFALGVGRREMEIVQEDRFSSPFNYKENCLLVFPQENIKATDPRFTDYMARLVCDSALMLGGRTLVLFSSTDRMKKVYDVAKPTLERAGISLLMTGQGGTKNLVETLRQDNHTVLFGSRMLWEGTDVAGQALSCVIIEKLHFPRPDDPLYLARLEKAQREILKRDAPELDIQDLTDESKQDLYWNAFNMVAVPPMVLAMRQKFGRLVRSKDDCGVVMVVDANTRAAYFRTLLASLPECRVVQAPSARVLDEMRRQFKTWGIDASSKAI